MRLPDEMEIPLIPLSVGGRLTSVVNRLRIRAKQRAGDRVRVDGGAGMVTPMRDA
jgi:hypothetical protein